MDPLAGQVSSDEPCERGPDIPYRRPPTAAQMAREHQLLDSRLGRLRPQVNGIAPDRAAIPSDAVGALRPSVVGSEQVQNGLGQARGLAVRYYQRPAFEIH